MKKVIYFACLSVCMGGCVSTRIQSEQAAYAELQSFGEKTPFELWVEMRRESEIKEVVNVVRDFKMKDMDFGTTGDAKKLPKTTLAKNKKFDRSKKTQDESEQ
jgi:hypothetical protein